MCVCSQGDTERASKTKVCKLEVALLVDKEILGLEVAVEHAVGVAVVEALYELVAEFLSVSGSFLELECVLEVAERGETERPSHSRTSTSTHPVDLTASASGRDTLNAPSPCWDRVRPSLQ